MTSDPTSQGNPREQSSSAGEQRNLSQGAEFFVYECSGNDGMETWAETYKDTSDYEERDCETLTKIVGWGGGWP